MPLTDEIFQNAIMDFERAIVIPGLVQGVIGKVEMVPVRKGKLASTDFGKIVGLEVFSDVPLAIDYYGYTKKSAGFFELSKRVRADYPKKQVKMVEATVVHFASLRIEDIASICSASEVIAEFPRLKGEVLLRRGFKK